MELCSNSRGSGAKENFYNKEKLDRERLRVGNKQVRSSYLDCRVDGCPFRIRFVEDITGCIHEYSTEDARAQHSEAAHDEEVDDNTNKGYYLNTYITISVIVIIIIIIISIIITSIIIIIFIIFFI